MFFFASVRLLNCYFANSQVIGMAEETNKKQNYCVLKANIVTSTSCGKIVIGYCAICGILEGLI